jgi:hypothetical protein
MGGLLLLGIAGALLGGCAFEVAVRWRERANADIDEIFGDWPHLTNYEREEH